MNRLLLFLTLLLPVACQEIDEMQYLFISTEEVDILNDTTAEFSAKIENTSELSIVESGFIWGVHSNDNNGLKIINNETSTSYNSQTNHPLVPGKTFYVRAYLETENAALYGQELTFETEGQVNVGSWSMIENNPGNRDRGLLSSFSINNFTYFLFDEILIDGSFTGSMFSYNHESGEFSFVQFNDLFKTADFSMTYNNTAYIFSNNSFYRFNPDDLSLTKLSSWPLDDRYRISGFQINDNGFIGLGQLTTGGFEHKGDFWKYNITSDSWESIAEYPGGPRSEAYCFSINNMGYVGGGYNFNSRPLLYYNDHWQYNPATDKWIEKEPLPFLINDFVNMSGSSAGEFGYLYSNDSLYEYNTLYNYWEKMADLNSNTYPYHLFTFDGQIHVAQAFEDSNSWDNEDNATLSMWRYAK